MGNNHFNSLLAGRCNLSVDTLIILVHLDQDIFNQPFCKNKQKKNLTKVHVKG